VGTNQFKDYPILHLVSPLLGTTSLKEATTWMRGTN